MKHTATYFGQSPSGELVERTYESVANPPLTVEENGTVLRRCCVSTYYDHPVGVFVVGKRSPKQPTNWLAVAKDICQPVQS